ncbi:hypothetical protein ACUH78_13235 [Thauera sp. ZXT1-4]|uniref:hypothetical protein n=1 Tax=Thauera sp. ZXT1-4 TaxID=3460294 RepID=UPI00404092EE
MKILCIAGAQTPDFERISAVLFAGGLEKARPVNREVTIDMEAWHRHVAPQLAQQRAPGRLWEQVAGDLLLANLQQAQWGWAGSHTIAALDFWADFEPGIHFLLLTCDPQDYLAYRLLGEEGDSIEDETAYLKQWQIEHEKMLAFYLANPERCLLVNVTQAAANPTALADRLAERWHFTFDTRKASFPALPGNHAVTDVAPVVLARYVAAQAWQQHASPLTPLTQELQAAQHPLPEPETQVDEEGNVFSTARPSLISVLKDYQRRCAQDLTESERQALSALEQQNAQLLQQLRDVQEALEQSTHEQRQLKQALEAAKRLPPPEYEQTKAALAESKEEGELLLLQLHQVQEELENVFLKHQEGEKTIAHLKQQHSTAITERDAARQQATALTQERDKAGQQIAALTQERDKAVQQITVLTQERDKLRKQADEQEGKLKVLMSEHEQAKKLSEEQARALKESQEEGELLLLQLHQVQEELEHYFLQNQKLNQELDQQKRQNRQLKHRCRQLEHRPVAPNGLLARVLGAKEKTASPHLDFEGLQLRQEKVNPDYEHLWITLQSPSFGDKLVDEWHFRLSCAGVKPGQFGQQPKLELPEQQAQLLEAWFAESESESGRKLELRFALPSAMDAAVWKQIQTADQAFVSQLIEQLPSMLDTLKGQGARISRDWADWQRLAADMRRIHQLKAK